MFDTFKKNGYKYKIYNGEFQYTDDSLCGWFAIFVAKMLQSNSNKINSNNIFRLVENTFGKTSDDNDIQELISSFGMTANGQMDKIYD